MPPDPLLYEIHARPWLAALGDGRPTTLDDVPDEALDRIAGLGFDWLWLMGAWTTGRASRAVSLADADASRHYRDVLPDLREADVCGSPYAVVAYEAHPDFGGNGALLRFRRRLADRGVKLMLDFVPNHVALDHRWVGEHPEFFIPGTESDLAREPHNYARVESSRGPVVLAHGRDPYFPGWTDTLQLNYRHPALRLAMIAELARAAGLCDGLRCDMAMLVLPEVFGRTWGDRARPIDGTPPVDEPFWPEAIARVRREHPDFTFLAEAYWDLEWALLRQGFDFAYDKRLLDRLRDRDAVAVRAHLAADVGYQRRLARFLENHDEPRAAAEFPEPIHRAAAIVTYLAPGMRFFHEGQLDGRKVRPSVHLGRRPVEPPDGSLRGFYDGLFSILRRPEAHGDWWLLEARPAWEGNPTWDRFLAFVRGRGDARLLVVVNFGPARGQCYVGPPAEGLGRGSILLRDLSGPARYERDAGDLATRGLYLDMPEWGYHLFEIARRAVTTDPEGAT